MKKQTVLKMADGRQFTLCLSIRDMLAIEQEIGKSLFSVIAEMGQGNLRPLDLRFTIAALRWALPSPGDETAVISLIEEHCALGGTLDDINQVLLQAIFATGLFSRGKNGETAAEEVPDKKK